MESICNTVNNTHLVYKHRHHHVFFLGRRQGRRRRGGRRQCRIQVGEGTRRKVRELEGDEDHAQPVSRDAVAAVGRRHRRQPALRAGQEGEFLLLYRV